MISGIQSQQIVDTNEVLFQHEIVQVKPDADNDSVLTVQSKDNGDMLIHITNNEGGASVVLKAPTVGEKKNKNTWLAARELFVAMAEDQ